MPRPPFTFQLRHNNNNHVTHVITCSTEENVNLLLLQHGIVSKNLKKTECDHKIAKSLLEIIILATPD